MPASSNPSPAEIVAALQRGGVVEALKLVLAAKQDGSTAKRSAGQVAHPAQPFRSVLPSSTASDLSPGEVPRSNTDIWIVLVVIGALCVAYYFIA